MPEEKSELEIHTEVVGKMLDKMVEDKVVTRQAVAVVAFHITCQELSRMSRKAFKTQYLRIKNIAKVMSAKRTGGSNGE